MGHLELILDERDVYYIKVCTPSSNPWCLRGTKHLPPPRTLPVPVRACLSPPPLVFFLIIYLLNLLAALSLSCGTRDLCCIIWGDLLL